MTTAIKGVFAHKYPDFNPAQQGIVYCKISEGKSFFPQFQDWWDRCGGVCRRGIYQYADIGVPVADNVSFMVQHLSNHAGGQSAVATEPIIFYANYGWSLSNIQLYIQYLYDECLPKGAPKPMVYITPKIWTQIYKGDDANLVAWNIADRADLCISAWDVTQPATFGSFPYPKAWEFANGQLQVKIAASDLFTPNAIAPTTPPAVIPPVTTPSISSEADLRVRCLDLALDLYLQNNPTSAEIAEAPVLQTARNFAKYAKEDPDGTI